jgi:hypothetical protein
MKIGCVIQGDYRRGTEEVLKNFPQLFDYTIFSTWEEDLGFIPDGNFSVIANRKPNITGLANRNLQRFSTARGIDLAKELGCDYILKWRSDMLPARLDLDELIKWANFDVSPMMTSRLVMPAFRNLSVKPDYFSSIPDLFSFADTHLMEMLWGDLGFDYESPINMPSTMLNGEEINEINRDLLGAYYSPESELYALFKEKLQLFLGLEISHNKFVLDYCRLFNEDRLRIYWFNSIQGFRSIRQGYEHPWWTEKDWQSKNPMIHDFGYPVKGFKSNVLRILGPLITRSNEMNQSFSWFIRSHIEKKDSK